MERTLEQSRLRFELHIGGLLLSLSLQVVLKQRFALYFMLITLIYTHQAGYPWFDPCGNLRRFDIVKVYRR